jgi:hypothetical protein
MIMVDANGEATIKPKLNVEKLSDSELCEADRGKTTTYQNGINTIEPG